MEMSANPGRVQFALPTHRDARDDNEDATRGCDALIVHPLSIYSSATSPTYSAEWHLAAFLFQRHEMQRLMKQQQQQPECHRHLSLMDYTCEENLKSILGYLDGASLCTMRRVCRQLHALGDNDDYWYTLCIAEWAISPDQLCQRPESFQALYKFACQSLQKLIRELFQEQCLSSMQKSFRIPRDAALIIARRSFISF